MLTYLRGYLQSVCDHGMCWTMLKDVWLDMSVIKCQSEYNDEDGSTPVRLKRPGTIGEL